MTRFFLRSSLVVALSTCGAAELHSEEPVPSSPTGLPEGFRLSPGVYPEGIADEAAFQDHLQQHEQRLRSDGQASASLLVSAQLKLALANHILGPLADAPATLYLMGRADPPQTLRLRQLADQASVLLASAIEELDKAEQNANDDEFDQLDELRIHAESLAGFAHIISAMTAEPGDATRKAVAGAVVELAGALESEETEFAASARLWHAAALARVGAYDDALSTLDLVLAKPKAFPYDFFARLMRCRILSDQDGEAVSVALTYRLEERCTEWFKDATQAEEAQRSVKLVRAGIARRWAQRMRQAGRAEVAERADALVEKSIQSARGNDADDSTLYRLGSAVPLVVTPPAGATTRFFSLSAYVERVVLVLDRSAEISADWPALQAEVTRWIQSLDSGQSFQIIVLGADGIEQVGSGNLLPANQANRQRAVDLVEALTTIPRTNVDTGLRKALSLKPERVILLTASGGHEGLARRVSTWNMQFRVAVDVVGFENLPGEDELERIAAGNQGRFLRLPRPLQRLIADEALPNNDKP